MNNTNQHLFAIYNNIHSFYDYRKLYALDPKMDQDRFIKRIQKDKYVVMSSIPAKSIQTESGEVDQQKLSKANDMPVVVVVLVYPGTECENKRANMLKILAKVQHPFAEVIVITPIKISPGVAKGLRAMSTHTKTSDRTFKAFTYTLFNSVLPEHDLVPKYEILDAAQIEALEEWHIDPNTLPKIFEHDPQMVWLGARVGDVVKFTQLSEITIEAIGYCKVVPMV